MGTTEERRSLEALEERSGEDIWQRIFDAVEDPMYILDRQGTILRANRAAGALLGATPESLVGRRCYEAVHGAAAFIDGCPFVRSWISRRRESYTLFIFGRWHRFSVDPLLDADGNVVGAIHLITDVSDIKRIDELRSHLAAILETSEDAIIGAGRDGTIVSMNASAERLFGIEAGKARGRAVIDSVPDAHKEEWKATIAQVAGGGPGRRFISELSAGDGGEVREVSVGISRILDDRGALGGLSFIIRDLSAQRKAERALVAYAAEASLRMKIPIGTISHEFDRLASLLSEGAVSTHEAVSVLKVQKTHLEQIARNLADLDRAIANSEAEIPEAYRRFLAGK